MTEWLERQVQTRDGLTVHLRDYPAVAPVTGAPVLCLHGLTRNSRDFEIVAPRIAALGRRVLAMDVRGRGRSSYDPEPLRYLPPTYAQDVIAALDQLGVPSAVFLGTSMGGLITMIVAAMAPDRVTAAILNDVGPKLNGLALARIAAVVGKVPTVETWEAAARLARDINEIAFPGRDEAFWLAFARRTFVEEGPGRIRPDYDPAIAAPFAQPSGAAPPDIGALFQAGLGAKPTLVVRGLLSDLITAQEVEAIRALKPDVELVDVPGVGHAPMLDEPEAWDALLMFLAKVG